MASIRRIHLSDAPRIFEIIEETRARAQAPIGPVWTFTQVEEECRRGGWVIESQGSDPEVLAFVFIQDTGSAWEIGFLATDSNARSRGLMTQLLDHVKAERSPDRPIWLEVHEQNRPARRLYEALGFKEVGKRPRYYSDGGSAILYDFGS